MSISFEITQQILPDGSIGPITPRPPMPEWKWQHYERLHTAKTKAQWDGYLPVSEIKA